MANKQSSFVGGLVGGLVGGTIIILVLAQSPLFLNRLKANLAAVPPKPTLQQSTAPFMTTDSHEAAVTSVVKSAQPAVVSIIITQNLPTPSFNTNSNNGLPNGFFDPFGGMFGNGNGMGGGNGFPMQMPPQSQQQPNDGSTQPQEIGGGSGFLVSADGYVVTNKHVVSVSGAQYTVYTNDGKKYDAKVVATDPANDVAILKIDGTNFPYLQFGDSGSIQVGQTAIAIGNALGEFRNTVSVGVISGLSRSITAGDDFGQAEQLDEVIQTDAAINPGNSGGPLLGLDGKVLGVNVAVAEGSQSVGFALPANEVASAVTQVEQSGKITRAFLGVRYTPITPTVQASNHLSVDYGVLVVPGDTPADLAVTPGSGADKAGIVQGDIILQADGVKLDDTHSLADAVKNKNVGDTMSLVILHKGEQKTVTVTLGALPQ